MKHYRTISIGMLLGVLFVLSASSVFAASPSTIADGHVMGQCVGWPKPHIELRWSDRQPSGALLPNMNAVLRVVDDESDAWFFGGAYPGVGGTRINGSLAAAFGPHGFPEPNFTVHDLRDDALVTGHTYAYTVKYRPEVPSTNTYAVTVNAANCGGVPEVSVASPIPIVRTSITTSAALVDQTPPPAGNIRGVCTWNGTSNTPQVDLIWSAQPPPGQGVANTNALQKGDLFPNDSTQYWGFLPNDPVQHVYTDTGLSLNTQYQYRVKYRPDLASSNTYAIYVSNATCGGPANTSGPLTLAPSSQTVPPAVTAFFTASGGDGNYGWEAIGGRVLGSGSTVGIVFANNSLQAITRTVTVHSGGQSVSVSVEVEGIKTFMDDIELTASNGRYVLINGDVPTTSDPNVTLSLFHGLPPGNDSAVTMRIANTLADASSAPIRSYRNQLAWNLCDDLPTCEAGPLTVYVIYRAPDGTELPVVMDNILYQKAGEDEPSVLIDGGAATTLNRTVTLALTHGFPIVDVRDEDVKMRIANTLAGLDVALDGPYTSLVQGWDLCGAGNPCPGGMKTVYVQYCAGDICQPVVQDDIMYTAVPCIPRPVCEDPLSACANPAEEPEGGWCPVVPASPGILIDDGAVRTTDRLVKLTFNTPFVGIIGEPMRIINANALSQRDRDIIAQRGGGIAGQGGFDQTSGFTRLPPETQVPELESGTLTNFTPSLEGWDLCQDVKICTYGTYKVYVQYYGIGSVIEPGDTLGAMVDQISEIYYDTIVYASPTPTPSVTPVPSITESPNPTNTPPGGPTKTPSIFGPVGEIIAGAAGIINSVSIVSAIAVTASAIAALIPLLTSGLGAFVYQWFMGVLGLLPGRKKTWGTVYDANTKRPIPFAKVQLLDRNRRVLETHIADKDGRYGFLTTPESLMAQNLQISILPSHEGYSFPSHTPASIDTFVYNNLYYGSVIEVNDKTLINFDIPMDPMVASRTPLFFKSPSIAAGAAVAAVADAGFWLGLIMVPLNFALSPSPFTFGVLCLFLGTASLRLFGISEHPFGAVIDSTTGRPMAFALITLSDMTGKRVGFAVSDERGRYFLVVEKGTYEMTVFTPATIVPPRRSHQTVTAKKGWITREIKV